MPIGFRRPPSIEQMVAKYVRQQLSQAAHEDGNETFDEADDFEVGDDADELRSPYEITADQELASLLKAKSSPADQAAAGVQPAASSPAPPSPPEASSPIPP